MDCTTRQLTVFVKPQMTDCGSESGKFLARKQARSTKGFPSPRDHGTCPGVPWIARLLTERGRLLEVTDYRIRQSRRRCCHSALLPRNALELVDCAAFSRTGLIWSSWPLAFNTQCLYGSKRMAGGEGSERCGIGGRNVLLRPDYLVRGRAVIHRSKA